jgi:DNA-binding IclR family transcriptional regulator
MASTDRSLSALKLFTLEKPTWTAEEVSSELQVSMSTAYRYLLALEAVGLVTTARAGKYILGPAIIQLDRQIQLTDPLLAAARPIMQKVSEFGPASSVVLLCRSYGESVLCMHQVHTKGPQLFVSYERGRPMPMFRGATSRIILAYQPTRVLKTLYAHHEQEISDSGIGASWDEFRAAMSKLRKAGHVVSHGEIDKGRIGIGAVLLAEDRSVMGGLSYVIPEDTDANLIPFLASVIQAGAKEIEATLKLPAAMPAVKPPVKRKKAA